MLASRQRRYAEWAPETGDLPATELAIAEDIRILEAGLRPADPKSVAVELARTLGRYRLPDHSDAEDRAEGAMEALEGVPLDIVQAALKRVRLECKWFPMPSEIRDRVVAEMGERRRAVAKAKVAQVMASRRRADADRTAPTDEERARVAGMVSRLVATRENIALKAEPERPIRPERDAIAAVMRETAGMRLPDADDPRVVEVMRRIGAGA